MHLTRRELLLERKRKRLIDWYRLSQRNDRILLGERSLFLYNMSLEFSARTNLSWQIVRMIITLILIRISNVSHYLRLRCKIVFINPLMRIVHECQTWIFNVRLVSPVPNPWNAVERLWKMKTKRSRLTGSKVALYIPGIPPAGCRNHWRKLISVERAEEMEDS